MGVHRGAPPHVLNARCLEEDRLSVSMRLVGLYLRMRSKRHFATIDGAHRMLARAKTASEPPDGLRDRHSSSCVDYEGFRCWTVEPRHSTPTRTVLYLHGGAYVNEIFPEHWALIDRIVEGGGRVVVPLYGLAPEHGYTAAYRLLTRVYRDILSTVRPADIAIAGDSAGGGLALGFAQTLLSTGLPQPDRLLLISPWLDLTLQNPDIELLARKDPWLAAPGARECGRVWAEGADPRIPQLSPLGGPLAGIAPMDIYIGTRDILLPDVLLLCDRAAAEGAVIDLTVCPGAVHVYPLTPTREGRLASAGIVSALSCRGVRSS